MLGKTGSAFLLASALLCACDNPPQKPACPPETKCYPIKSESDAGIKDRVVRWSYDSQGKLTQKLVSTGGSYLSAYSYFMYDGEGRLSILQRVKRGWDTVIPEREFTYQYDAEGLLIRREYYDVLPSSSNPYNEYVRVSQTPQYYDLYEYNSSGQRISMKTFTADGTLIYPFETYAYDTQGNMEEVYFNSTDASYLACKYTYDDKNSMFLGEPDTGDSPVRLSTVDTVPMRWFRDLYPISRHNLIQVKFYDETGAVLSTSRYSYEYNDKCFPVETQGVYTVTYNCL